MSDEFQTLDGVLDFLSDVPSVDIIEEGKKEDLKNPEIEQNFNDDEPLPPIDIFDHNPDEEVDEDDEIDLEEKEKFKKPASTTTQTSGDQGGEDDDDEEGLSGDQNEQITAVGQHFSKLGLLALEEGEDPEKIEWTEETFIEKAKAKWEEEAWLKMEQLATERFGEFGTEFMEKVLVNGMPYAEFFSSMNRQESIENLSPEEDGELILRAYYQAMGFEQDDIEEQVQLATENNTLVAKAAKFKNKLAEATKQEREALAERNRALLKEKQERDRKMATDYASIIKSAVKEGSLNGVPINNKDTKALFDFVIDRPHILQNGQKITDFEYKLAKMRVEEPEKFLTVAKILMDDVNLSSVVKAEKSKKVESIFGKGQKSLTKPRKEDYSFLFKNLK